ncbi:MAG: glutamate formimidoyltransferase [Planctomycetota bacterium]|jgi:glutamate formiminotransferase
MIIESVPNFSEGRRQEVVDAIAEAVRGAAGATLLDVQSDKDHNRSVVTFIGQPAGLKVAAVAAVKKAMELIDLTKHEGTHPRMGACDVLPFIPIRDADMADAITLAREAGEAIGNLGVPVFLYEAAATRPERRNLADIRNKNQFEGLRDLIGKDATFEPDFGPNAIHPTFGAMGVGARMPLIAYNVDLETDDVKIAKKIAKKVRERSGGFPGVKALGMFIEDRKCAEVSMNVCDYTKTSLMTVFKEIERLAKKKGVEVRSSEVVGLLPASALEEGWIEELKLADFTAEQIIENRI